MSIPNSITVKQQLVKDLVSDLDTNNFIKSGIVDIPDNLKGVHKRLSDYNQMLKKWGDIIANKKGDEFLVDVKKWFNEDDVEIIHSNLTAYYALELMELFNQLLHVIINPNMTLGGKQTDKINQLGDWLAAFSNQFSKPDYKTLMNNRLRINLAHGLWYWKQTSTGGRLCYDNVTLDWQGWVDEVNNIDEVFSQLIEGLENLGMNFRT